MQQKQADFKTKNPETDSGLSLDFLLGPSGRERSADHAYS